MDFVFRDLLCQHYGDVAYLYMRKVYLNRTSSHMINYFIQLDLPGMSRKVRYPGRKTFT